MLHHDQGIAQITQALQGHQQFVVIPLMEANGRLVQNVEDAHERRSDLSSQTDTLALTAGQGRRATAECQILQTHIHEKLKSTLDLADDLLRDHCHIACELQILHKLQTLANAHAAEVHDADTANGYRTGNIGKAVTMAVRAGSRCHTLFQFLAGCIGLGLPVTAADIIEDALKGLLQYTHTVTTVIGHTQLLPFGTIENDVHSLPGKGIDGVGQREMVLLGQRLKVHAENRVGTGICPAGGLDGATEDGLCLIGDH